MLTLNCQYDEGLGARARLGLIVLQADESIEPYMMRTLNLDGVVLYHARIPSEAEMSVASLQKTQHELTHAAGLFPSGLKLDAVAYACTSASALIGEAAVADLIRVHHPEALVTNPFSAAKVVLKQLGAKRIGLVSPYGEDVVQSLTDNLREAGFTTSVSGSFQQTTEAKVARIDEDSILDAVIQVGQSASIDAVFVSCTNLRAANVIEAAEAVLDIPVISSNQAIAWHLLRLAGVNDLLVDRGRLFNVGALSLI